MLVPERGSGVGKEHLIPLTAGDGDAGCTTEAVVHGRSPL